MDNNKLKIIQLSREGFELINDLLNPDEIGNVITALGNYMFNGIEPDSLTKCEKYCYNKLKEYALKSAEAYIKKISMLKNQNTAVEKTENKPTHSALIPYVGLDGRSAKSADDWTKGI